jgi:RecA-family ATPase
LLEESAEDSQQCVVGALFNPSMERPAFLDSEPLKDLTPNALSALASAFEPAYSGEVAEHCEQVRALRDKHGRVPEPLWYAALGVLAFCEDGNRFAHEWSRGDDRYTEHETQERLDRARQLSGATTCGRFHSLNASACDRCSWWQKIRSPIMLGSQEGPIHDEHEKEPFDRSETRGEGQRKSSGSSNTNPDETHTAGLGNEQASRRSKEEPGSDGDPRTGTSAGGESANAGHSDSSERFRTFRGDELLSKPAAPRRWLVDRFIPASETTMIGGDGGAGKTTLGLQLGLANATGSDWFGLKVTQCNTLYVSAEDPTEEIHFRLEQIVKQSKISDVELCRFKLIDLAGRDATIAQFGKDGQMKPTPLFSDIENVAREHGAKCIIFDSVADFFGGNENERREARAFVGLLRGLAMRLGAAVVFLAHPSVDGIKSGRGYSGSTHWNNAVRSRLYFTDAPKSDGGPSNSDLRVIELAKTNRARRGERIHVIWMEGRFVRITPDAAEASKNEVEADAVFLELLSRRIKQGLSVSPSPSRSYAPAEFAKEAKGKAIGKAALDRAMHRLLDQGKIRVVQSGPPSRRTRHLEISVAATSGTSGPQAAEPGTQPGRPAAPGGMGE